MLIEAQKGANLTDLDIHDEVTTFMFGVSLIILHILDLLIQIIYYRGKILQLEL